MTSAVDRAPSSHPSPLSGRRIISRLTSPFTTKSRSVGEFYINVDNPHRQYGPGDVVTGNVRLRVSKAIRVTHIVVCLHGFVQVFKNPGSPGEGPKTNTAHIGTGRGKRSGEYFGNGFASLFEDEEALCGEGRLSESNYQFNFELQFPDSGLPSSIDFERGTISYMITATLTRPTTISPTMTCDHKVYFMDTVDITPIFPPKDRTITLEPISRRSRAKNQARRLVDAGDRLSRKDGSTTQSDADATCRLSNATSSSADAGNALSPSPSEISFASVPSSSERTSQAGSSGLSPGGNDSYKGNSSKASLITKVVTVNIRPLIGGCLRGDSIPIKVTVNHNKTVKSLHGIIVTFYRQARVDLHPAIAIGPTEKGKEDKFEDYYPRSLTGLGGLSLSGAGSSHVFRKDLAQTSAPLYIDPLTLTADITAKIRVPDDVFPSIGNVPGQMITFKYFVEVMVDVQGKLGNQDRSIAGLNIGNSRQQMGVLEGQSQDDEQRTAMPFGAGIFDTTPIRRYKGVVSNTFEIVVGTQDSARRKGKRRLDPSQEEPQPEQHAQQVQAPTVNNTAMEEQPNDPEGYWYCQQDEPYQHIQWYDQQVHNGAPRDGHHTDYDESYYEPPTPIPLPAMPDESLMTEKERVQLAESRLLPSQPPAENDESSAHTPLADATAPYLPDENELPLDTVAGASAPAYDSAASSSRIHPPLDTGPGSSSQPSAPTYQYTQAGASSSQLQIPYTDDKHELERRSLEHAASAPLEERIDEAFGDVAAATAPTEEEVDVSASDSHTPSAVGSTITAVGSTVGLPQYER